MNLNSSQLEAFYVCAQVRHFTKAAERLHISQSALSQRIIGLEEELETTLIIRDRSGLRLSAEGEELLRYCRQLNQFEEQVIGKIKGQNQQSLSGTLRVGGFSTVMNSLILPALAPLIKENSNLKIHFITRETYELPALLNSGEIDYMFLDKELNKEKYVSLNLGFEEYVLVKKKGGRPPQVYLDHDEADETTTKLLGLKNNKKIKQQYFDDIYGILEGVKLGLGYGALPKHLIKNDDQVSIVKTRSTLKSPIQLHFFEQAFYSSLHSSFLGALQNHLK